MYKILIRSLENFGCEVSNFVTAKQNILWVCERKVIYIFKHQKRKQLFEKPDMVDIAKYQRLTWLGHMKRITTNRASNRISKEQHRRQSRFEYICVYFIYLINYQYDKQNCLKTTKWRLVDL